MQLSISDFGEEKDKEEGKKGDGGKAEKNGMGEKGANAESSASISDFMKFSSSVGKEISSFSNVLLVGHFDADGISSTAIIALFLKQKNIPFRVLTAKKTDSEILERIEKDSASEIILSDLGAGFLQKISEMKKRSIVVLDHHPPEKISNNNVSLVNPHVFGLDGAVSACSASVAFSTLFRHVPISTAKRMAELSIVGAVGDMQDKSGGFIGVNSEILSLAKKMNVVEVRKDLRIFGRVSRTLVNFLSFCSEPFLPELTGNSKACALFLKKNNIHFLSKSGERSYLHYYDLSEEEKRKFAGALIAYCIEKKVKEQYIRAMVGDVYLFPSEQKNTELFDAYEFSTVLNACGRTGHPDVGIKLCISEGEERPVADAHRLLIEHRRAISEGIYFARSNVEDFGSFYFLDGRDAISDSIIGTIAGSFFNSGIVERDKPIIAFSIDEKNNIKVSSRACRELIEKGLNLGEVMQVSSSVAGGNGGGHNIAAGGSISPPAKESESAFLLKCAETIRRQLGE